MNSIEQVFQESNTSKDINEVIIDIINIVMIENDSN